MSGRYVEIEGVVKRIGDKSLWFRESDADHDICIPLGQVENPDAVSEGDNFLRCSRWILRKLEEEGAR